MLVSRYDGTRMLIDLRPTTVSRAALGSVRPRFTASMLCVLGMACVLGIACGGTGDGDTNDATVDDALVDGGDSIPWERPSLALPGPDATEPFLLSQTGLYSDFGMRDIAPDLIEFAPTYPLWTDGAEKRRFLYLPADGQIDTSEADDWRFPVGAMAFKEFSREGKRLETRLIVRTGEGSRDYWFGAFVWRDDDSDAVFTPDGASDVRGTTHDVPTQTQCGTCHNGEPGRILGVSEVQLAGGPVMADLIADDRMTTLPAGTYKVPGDAEIAAGLGYLHANCGHCHNPFGSARPDADMDLTLSVSQTEVELTNAYRSTVNVLLQNFRADGLMFRIAPGQPDESAVFRRMESRGDKEQMPSLGTELADQQGSDAVRALILALPGPEP